MEWAGLVSCEVDFFGKLMFPCTGSNLLLYPHYFIDRM